MVGREVNALFSHRDRRHRRRGGARRRRADAPRQSRATRTPPCSTTSRSHVRRGEILGIAGLVGAGRTEMARAIFGADPFDAGRILVDGKPVDDPLAAGRHPPRHRPGAGGPQAAGAVPVARHPHELSAWRRSARLTKWGVFVDEASGEQAGRGVPQGAQHPHGEPGPDRRQPLRRQPAEGGAGALAGAAAEGADRRRADARHRRRRQGRGAQSAVRDGALRHRRHRHLLGAAGGAGDQRPHRHDARGARDRRDRARRGRPGNADVDDDASPKAA